MHDDVGLDRVEVVESFWEDPDIFFLRGPFMKRLKISSSRFLGDFFLGNFQRFLMVLAELFVRPFCIQILRISRYRRLGCHKQL